VDCGDPSPLSLVSLWCRCTYLRQESKRRMMAAVHKMKRKKAWNRVPRRT
jgi:hypothetical protein